MAVYPVSTAFAMFAIFAKFANFTFLASLDCPI
jgi:hypothetical protein